jgi:hypothetical protein
LENMGGAGTDSASIEGFGHVTLNANCSGGTAVIRGNIKITDNSGSVTVDKAAAVNLSTIWEEALTEAYAADGAAGTAAQILYLIQQAVTEFAISGTTKTIKKIDGSTTAATETLDDASNPTSITRAT